MSETPEERKARLLKNLEKARATQKAKREAIKAGTLEPKPLVRKRPKNLDRVIREILDDEELVDLVVQNQPDWWSRLPVKNASYIISTVMTIKAMGGDIKAAEWIRKSGFGDKVLLETDNGFFQKDQFTIQVLPSKQVEDSIGSTEVLEEEIKQIEDNNVS